MEAARLSRTEVLALAGGVTGAYVYLDGPTVVVESLQVAEKSIILKTEDLATSLRHAFSTIGADAPKSRILMTRTTAHTLLPALGDELKANRVFVLDPDFGQVPVRIEKLADGGTSSFRELVAGLYVELDESLSEDVVRLLKSQFRSEQLRLISAFHEIEDADSVKRVAEVVGDRFSDLAQIVRPDGSVSFRAFSGKTVIVMGHIEDGSFVVKGLPGSIRSVPISLLEEAAREADVTLLSAGCATEPAGASNGFLHYITDSGFASSLQSALSGQTYAEFFGRLGKDSPFVVSDRGLRTLAGEYRLQLESLNAFAKPINIGLRSVRMYEGFRGLSEIYRPELEGLAFTNLAAFSLFFRRSRSAFINEYPILPSPKLRPVIYTIIRAWREISFVLVGPFVSLFTLLAIPAVGWEGRGTAIYYLWSWLRQPGQFIAKLLFGLSFLFVCMCVVVTIVPFTISVTEALRVFGVYNGYIDLAIYGLGLIVCLYAVKALPTRLADMLSRTLWPLEVKILALLGTGVGLVMIGFVADYTVDSIAVLVARG